MARRWARGFVITVAVGVVTGTAIGLQLSLLWPNFMQLAGQTIALPLFMETFAFFFEAIFLGIYLYTWDRFDSQKKHMLLLIPVAVGASMSAVFITIVNAFMNAPQGFDIVDGQLVNIQPFLAMFNPAMPTKVAHVLVTAYMTSAFVLAAIAGYRMLRGSKHVYHKKSLLLLMKIGLIFSIAAAIIGDFSGKYLAEYQPEKLAAAEWHFETEDKASLILFGVLDGEEVKYAIKVPYALSILAYNNPTAEVIGLDQFAEEDRPLCIFTISLILWCLSACSWRLFHCSTYWGKHVAGNLSTRVGLDGLLSQEDHFLSLLLKLAGGSQKLDDNLGFYMV